MTIHGNNLKISLKSYALTLLLFWTVIISVLCVLEIHGNYDNARRNARESALSSYNKDLVYRRWATLHGGVYVPATPETPPNPYLSHINERDIVTPSGRALTLINPAYLTRQVHELGKEQYGYYGHITSLNPIRPENRSDSWETEALKNFEKGSTEQCEILNIDGRRFMRLMRPLIAEAACLKCHESQGYKLGDIRGGISVSLPMKDYEKIAYDESLKNLGFHLLLWLGCALIIFIGYQEISRRATEQERAEESLMQTLCEKETLLRELYHRTKNTMQVIGGMIELQALDHPENDDLQRLVWKTKDRIQAISLVHQMLYKSNDLSQISIKEYIQELSSLILKSFALSKEKISLNMNIDEQYFLLDTAIPFGLIFTELLTNSLKYAFPDNKTGVITIALTAGESDKVVFNYSDNGAGVFDGFDFRKQKTLGMQLIHSIGEKQMLGNIVMRNNNGVSCLFEFRKNLYKLRV